MKEIENREIGRGFGNYGLYLEWGEYGYGNGKGRYGYGFVDVWGNGFGNGNGLGKGDGDVFGYMDGNGFSRIR
jgi:hypothetical protein